MTMGDLRSLGYAAIPQQAGSDDKPRLQVPRKLELLTRAEKKFVQESPLRFAANGQKAALRSAIEKTERWLAKDNLPPLPDSVVAQIDDFEKSHCTYCKLHFIVLHH